MKLSIKDQIGPRCIIKEDGQNIYDAIHRALQNGETVTFDFEGMSQFVLYLLEQRARETDDENNGRNMTNKSVAQGRTDLSCRRDTGVLC